MKLTIITATFNSAANIAQCLQSVNSQTYADIEHIIVDGASTDETLEIFAFMQAAEESKLKGGVSIDIDSVVQIAKSENN